MRVPAQETGDGNDLLGHTADFGSADGEDIVCIVACKQKGANGDRTIQQAKCTRIERDGVDRRTLDDDLVTGIEAIDRGGDLRW
jgi:hypothetical protein